MARYVSQRTVNDCVAYFKRGAYSKGEQLGLFLLFKGQALTPYGFMPYEKWGSRDADEKRRLMRMMYDLSATYNACNEVGLKRSSLFPMAANDFKFYNAGTAFNGLGSRISDTLNNALVGTFMAKDPSNDSGYKFTEDYIDRLRTKHLRGRLMPLELLAGWYYKFWLLDLPNDIPDRDIEDACIISFVLHFGILPDEYNQLFSYTGTRLSFSNAMVTGPFLRDLYRFPADKMPETIDSTGPGDNSFDIHETFTGEQFRELIALRGEQPLTEQRLLEILQINENTQRNNAQTNTGTDNYEVEVEHEELPDFLSIDQLAQILSRVYSDAPEDQKKTCVQVFGIKFGPIIIDNGYDPRLILETAGIGTEYTQALIDALKIYQCIRTGQYGLSFVNREQILGGVIRQMNLTARTPRTNRTHPLNSILYGAPGTGKTYSSATYALAIIENQAVENYTHMTRADIMTRYKQYLDTDRIKFTTFHQNYGYEDFIQGIRPRLGETGPVSFVLADGVFKKIAEKAMDDPDQTHNYVIIIDEINRANISKVFGELITLIEDDKRWGEQNALSATLPSGELFAIPNNLYILGTMNSADKSISLIDTALRRRFDFVEIAPDADKVTDPVLKTVLTRINDALWHELESTDLLIGHAYFIGKAEGDLCEIMNHSIIPLLYEYFYDNKNKVANVVNTAIHGYNYELTDGTVGRLRLVPRAEQHDD